MVDARMCAVRAANRAVRDTVAIRWSYIPRNRGGARLEAACAARRTAYILRIYMQTRIDRWGNSLGLRLPKSVAQRVGLREGDRVDIDVDGSTLRIRRARPRYTLDELLVGMTQEMTHDEFADAGEVGLERFWEAQ